MLLHRVKLKPIFKLSENEFFSSLFDWLKVSNLKLFVFFENSVRRIAEDGERRRATSLVDRGEFCFDVFRYQETQDCGGENVRPTFHRQFEFRNKGSSRIEDEKMDQVQVLSAVCKKLNSDIESLANQTAMREAAIAQLDANQHNHDEQIRQLSIDLQMKLSKTDAIVQKLQSDVDQMSHNLRDVLNNQQEANRSGSQRYQEIKLEVRTEEYFLVLFSRQTFLCSSFTNENNFPFPTNGSRIVRTQQTSFRKTSVLRFELDRFSSLPTRKLISKTIKVTSEDKSDKNRAIESNNQSVSLLSFKIRFYLNLSIEISSFVRHDDLTGLCIRLIHQGLDRSIEMTRLVTGFPSKHFSDGWTLV